MGVYYPGDGTTRYSGQDRVNRISELRAEAACLRESGRLNRRIGYSGTSAHNFHVAVQLQKEADHLESRD